jgi:hypothetical protein
MTTLARLLFPAPAIRRSPAVIFGWWEDRRPVYNLIVGATGLVTLGAVELLNYLPPHDPNPIPWAIGVVVYGIAANVCYTFGSVAEALLARLFGDELLPVGPTLFRHGLVFSVGLTLLPIGFAWLDYLVSALKYVL